MHPRLVLGAVLLQLGLGHSANTPISSLPSTAPYSTSVHRQSNFFSTTKAFATTESNNLATTKAREAFEESVPSSTTKESAEVSKESAPSFLTVPTLPIYKMLNSVTQTPTRSYTVASVVSVPLTVTTVRLFSGLESTTVFSLPSLNSKTNQASFPAEIGTGKESVAAIGSIRSSDDHTLPYFPTVEYGISTANGLIVTSTTFSTLVSIPSVSASSKDPTRTGYSLANESLLTEFASAGDSSIGILSHPGKTSTWQESATSRSSNLQGASVIEGGTLTSRTTLASRTISTTLRPHETSSTSSARLTFGSSTLHTHAHTTFDKALSGSGLLSQTAGRVHSSKEAHSLPSERTTFMPSSEARTSSSSKQVASPSDKSRSSTIADVASSVVQRKTNSENHFPTSPGRPTSSTDGSVHNAFGSSEKKSSPKQQRSMLGIAAGATGASVGLGITIFLVLVLRLRRRDASRSRSRRRISRPSDCRNTLGL